MKSKMLNLIVIITSLIGYLSWGKNNHTFLYEAEIQIISQLFTNPLSAAHPMTLIPLFGQIILAVTLFQKKVSKSLTFIAIGCLTLLLLLIFVIGLLTTSLKIIFSTLPFITIAYYTIRHHTKKQTQQ